MSQNTQRHAACCELVHDVARSAGEVRLRVAGASMLPAIWPGDLLTARSCEFAGLQAGEIVLYRRDGKLTAHRILKSTSDHLITRGDSVPACDAPVLASEIVGRVEIISRAGRAVRPEQSGSQRAASAILRKSNFLLRMTLFLGRRFRSFWDPRTPFTSASPAAD